MGSRHRKQRRALTTTHTVGAAGALLAAGPAVVGVLLLSSPHDGPAVGAGTHAKPVAQDGRIVALSPVSLTAQSADGTARTYVVTPQTTSVTPQGGGSAAALPFVINDEVSIVGEMRDGTAVATAVAARAVSNLDGPPMDSVGYTP
jgi:hypothetical protein